MLLCDYSQPLFKMHDCIKCMEIVRRFVKCMGIVRRYVKCMAIVRRFVKCMGIVRRFVRMCIQLIIIKGQKKVLKKHKPVHYNIILTKHSLKFRMGKLLDYKTDSS